MTNNLKIFLAYHKKSPLYKSEIFIPIKVGNGELDGCISDKTGDNISDLNPYYCELTGQYWVLKNYLKNSTDDYIGFAHYRRLPDITNISDTDIPAIFGLNFSESLTLFEKLNNSDLYEYIKDYDIILPCSCYMYSNTVNPLLRTNEQNLNTYEHFKTEHNSDLLDILKEIITKNYPDYTDSLNECYSAEKSHFYNMYIMKKEFMQEYLTFLFNILKKTGEAIGGWTQDKYLRMAGFLSETIINIWVKKHSTLKLGYMPVYMIDFEAEYIENANKYHSLGQYDKELIELEQLLKITNNKFVVSNALLECSIELKNKNHIDNYINIAESYANNEEDYYNLGATIEKTGDIPAATKFFRKASELSNDKFYARSYLNYAEKNRDIDEIKNAWEQMLKYELTENEKNDYKHFQKIYSMVKN